MQGLLPCCAIPANCLPYVSSNVQLMTPEQIIHVGKPWADRNRELLDKSLLESYIFLEAYPTEMTSDLSMQIGSENENNYLGDWATNKARVSS